MPQSFHTHVEPFAELLAHLDDPFSDRDALFHAAGIDEVSCRKLREHWVAIFQQEPSGFGELAQRFSSAYEHTRKALRAARHGNTERVGARPRDPRFLSTEAQSWREDAAAVPLYANPDAVASSPAPLPASPPLAVGAPERAIDRAIELGPMVREPPLPTYLQAARQAMATPPVVAEPVAAFLGTMAPLDTAPGTELPFARVEPAAVALENAQMHAVVVQSPRVPPPSDALGTTAIVNDNEASTPETLPFGPEGAADIQRPPPAAPMPTGAFHGTLSPIATPPVAAVPFAGRVPAAAALESAQKHAEAVQRPLAPPSQDDLGETAIVEDVRPLAPKSLPFTDEAPTGSADAPAANLPELTVQQYASLRVELRMYPDRTAHTLARHRVPSEARAQLDRQWQARFAADPALLDAYSRAYTTYQASLAGAGGAVSAPQDAAARSPVVQLSLEQYAALSVEISANPGHAAEIQARYGIRTPAAWAMTWQHWDTRLRQEPALQARWAALTREIAASRSRNG